jgi:spore maturation protein SpmA
MLNPIWVVMLMAALVCGALTGQLDAVAKASTDSAKAAVDLAIGLVGVMAFWLGLMRVLQQGGLLKILARIMRPLMTRLFPDVPPDHPAMSMMILNMTSNMLGLGNAATPFGLKAMMELNKLNKEKGTASNAMALFLAINTSNVALLPTGIIALRASLGSGAAGSIVATTLLATLASTCVAIFTAKAFSKLPFFNREVVTPVDAPAPTEDIDTSDVESMAQEDGSTGSPQSRMYASALALLLVAALGYALYQRASTGLGWEGALKAAATEWPLVLLIGGFLLFGVARGVRCYDAVVEGGKEGFDVALRIIPYLVTILVAVGMLRASGAIDLMVGALEPLTSMIGMPGEVLPMALLRPLSGSGAYGVAAEIMQTHGPDSLIGQIVSTMQGSTETTFYVMALYLGVVHVKNARHTLAACLVADLAGVLASVWVCLLLLT